MDPALVCGPSKERTGAVEVGVGLRTIKKSRVFWGGGTEREERPFAKVEKGALSLGA